MLLSPRHAVHRVLSTLSRWSLVCALCWLGIVPVASVEAQALKIIGMHSHTSSWYDDLQINIAEIKLDVQNTTSTSTWVFPDPVCASAFIQNWYDVNGNPMSLPCWTAGATIPANGTATVSLYVPLFPYASGNNRVTVRSGTSMDSTLVRVVVNDWYGTSWTASIVAFPEATFTPHIGHLTSANVSANGRRSTTFSIWNSGSAQATYTFAASCTGALTSCNFSTLASDPSTSTRTIAAGASSTLTAFYTTGAVGSAGQLRVVMTAPPRTSGLVEADTSNLATNALDLATPTITIQQFGSSIVDNGDNWIPADTATITVTFCDADGSLGTPTLNVSGTLVTATSMTNTTQSGCYTSKRATYNPAYLDGYGGVTATVSDGYHTATQQAWYKHSGVRQSAAQIVPLHPTITAAINSAHVDTFVVTNPGPETAHYDLALSCSANPWTLPCSMSSTYSSISLAPSGSIRIPISYTLGAVGSSVAANLYATWSGYFDTTTTTGRFTATVVGTIAPTITVTPAGGTVVSSSPISQVRIDWCDADDGLAQHDVTWQGQALPNAYVATTRAGCYAAGTSTYNNLAINLWQQSLLATATDVAGHSVTSTTTFTFSPPLTTFAPHVVTSSEWHKLPSAGAVTAADTFTVTNSGSYTAAYAIAPLCGGTATLTNCTANAGSLSLAAGASNVVIVTYTRSGALDRTDTLKLAATYSSPLGGVIADTGRKVVIAPSVEAAPIVTATQPSFSMSPTVVMAAVWFTLRNTSSIKTRYQLAFAATTPFGIRTAAETLTVDPGQVGYPAASVIAASTSGATGTLTVTATYVATNGQTLSATGSTQLATTGGGSSGTIALAVSGSSSPLLAPGSSGTVTFTVQNTSAVSGTITYTRACSGPAIAVCGSLNHSTVTLASNQSDVVTVNVTAGTLAGQAGTVTLTATSGSTVASGSVAVSTGVVRGPIAISTGAQLNPGTSIVRDECLTIAAGDDGAYECGELRLVHALPVTTTMNTPRSPTLIYMSGQAHPVTLIAANVAVDGTICPAQITATIRFNGDSAQRTVGWNGACGQATSRRIVVPVDAQGHSQSTGIFHYTFEALATVNGTRYTVSDTGSFAVVNRASNRFGAGWWLDGLEELYTVAGRADQMLWVGGDGSTRLYTQQPGSSTFLVQPTVDRPDTLEQLVGGAGYKRHLRNGAYVQFDGMLHHTATANASGHITKFYWGATQLDSVLLPVPDANNSSARRLYRFAYANGVLTSVTAPQDPNGARVTALLRTAVAGGTDLAITDPGVSAAVHYVSDTSGRINVRTNRLTDGTRYDYDAATGLVTRVGIDLTRTSLTTDSIRTTFCPAEGSSLVSCAAAVSDPSSVRTLLDGPRTDIADTTAFYLTAFGAPRMIVNALGYTTTIERADARWPVLATAIVQPNGHRVTATYTDRGLIAAQRDTNPFGDGRVAVTQYQWNTIYDEPDLITGPSGETTRFGYFANGDRQWEEDGRGSISRVQYTYTSSARQLATVQPPGNSAAQVERLDYDAVLGNLQRETSPLGFATDHRRDALGRDTLTLLPTDAAQTASLEQSVRTIYSLRGFVDSTIAIGAQVSYALRSTPTFTAPITADTAFTSHRYDDEGNRISTLVRAAFSVNGEIPVQTSEAWTYDAAGRVRVHLRNSVRDSTFYDPASNVTRVKAAGGGGYTAQYDALDRVIQRTVASRSYAQQRCEGLMTGPITDANYVPNCFVVFPAYPNAGTSYATPNDIATFTYDANGNVLSADNHDARVHRQYNPNGSIKLDSTAYLSVTGNGFVHATGIAMHYDASGHRDLLTLPDGRTNSYAYRSDNGALSSISDQFGNLYRYTFDGGGRIDSLDVGSGGVREHRSYDADGRQYARQRVSAGLGQLNNETVTFDAQGRVTQVGYSTRANGTPADNTYIAYSGLGAVLARERVDQTGNWETEEFRVDALGNVLRSRSESRDFNANVPFSSTYNRRGALTGRVADADSDHPLAFDQMSMGVDIDGNTFVSDRTARDRNNTPTIDTPTRSYYDGDGRLRAVQRYNLVGTNEAGTWEEYRYDAYGRRTEVISRPGGTPPACATIVGLCALLCNVGPCAPSVTWAMYDGDQILQEERRAFTGSDFGDLSAPRYGIVRYVHGLELDKPLAVIDAGQAVHVLNPNWRGLFESSVTPNGAAADCSLGTGTCQFVAWPAGNAVYSRPAPVENFSVTFTWMGSLLTDQQDGTGQLYRRHRYFDPDAGRFTQEDPAGLGGGSNLYGFAGGDPVNFTDPFGLWPCPELCTAGALGIAAGGETAIGSLAAGGPAGWIAIGGIAVAGLLDHASGSRGVPALSIRAPADASAVILERRSGRSLKKEWEGLHGTPWPAGCVAHHDCALADGGKDDATNIVPLPASDHVELHKSKGDFKRWGSRSQKEPDKPKDPQQPESRL